jgi:uncharacterized protein YndB with AHSA1/START domain
MTVLVEVDTRIARQASEVFRALADIERYPEWLIASGIVSVERLDPGPLAVGSLLRIGQTVAGRSTVLDGSVTAFAPGSMFGITGKDKDGVSIDIDAALTADGGSSDLRWTLRIRLPLRYRMFESMVTPQARRAALLDLEAFKRRLESTVPD